MTKAQSTINWDAFAAETLAEIAASPKVRSVAGMTGDPNTPLFRREAGMIKSLAKKGSQSLIDYASGNYTRQDGSPGVPLRRANKLHAIASCLRAMGKPKEADQIMGRTNGPIHVRKAGRPKGSRNKPKA